MDLELLDLLEPFEGAALRLAGFAVEELLLTLDLAGEVDLDCVAVLLELD